MRPTQEKTASCDAIQRLSLAHRFYGYRLITALLRQAGWTVDRKRLARIRQTANLLWVIGRTFHPPTTDSRHSFVVYPNLRGGWRP